MLDLMQTTLHVPRDLQRKIKVIAAERDITLGKAYCEMMEDFIKKYEKLFGGTNDTNSQVLHKE